MISSKWKSRIYDRKLLNIAPSSILKYVLFWIFLWALEVVKEFAWILRSLEELGTLKVFIIASLTEFTLHLVRIPCVILVYRIFLNTKFDTLAKIFLIILSISIGSIVFRLISIEVILRYLFEINPETQNLIDFPGLVSAAINLIFASGLFFAFDKYLINQSQILTEEKLKREKLQIELKLLRGQLNPHFLFNTLNNIYGLSRIKSDKAPIIILGLSDLLRFMLYEADELGILLIKEIEVVKKYIELQKIRFDDRLSIKFKTFTTSKDYKIPSFLILHLIENAFKHSSSESTDSVWIEIDISQSDNHCFIYISNSKSEMSIDKTETEAIGLGNIRAQLDLLYKNYGLTISDEKETFNIKLCLPNSL